MANSRLTALGELPVGNAPHCGQRKRETTILEAAVRVAGKGPSLLLRVNVPRGMAFSLYHAIWWTKRPVRLLRKRIRALVRIIRYGRMPNGGWGCGWRVLVFRYLNSPRDELHVLAPVSGDDFDWEVLKSLFAVNLGLHTNKRRES